jgi:two-component system, NarL family, nitrate/nitrite response regulator NarL
VSSQVRIVVADDHPLYRASVVRAIKQHPGLELVAEAGGGREALAAIRAELPDLALIDLQMPDLDGNAIVDTVQQERLPSRVVLLSGALDSASVYAALERGAAGVLSKLVDVDELLDALLAIARGETVIAEEVQAAVAAEIRLRSRDDRPILSEREREILGHVADGESIPTIARELHISVSTVKSHVEHLYRKLGVSDRAAAVATAMRRGLLR